MIKKILRVAVVGKPNVGKSTLVNLLTGSHACIISERCHATKECVYAAMHYNYTEVVFVDTPGISNGNTKNLNILNRTAKSAVYDVDVIMYLFDVNLKVPHNIIALREQFAQVKGIAVITKVDSTKLQYTALPITQALSSSFTDIFYTSNTKVSTANVKKFLFSQAKPGEWMIYERTNRHIDDIIKDRVIEALLDTFYQEIPHQVEVTVNDMENDTFDIVIYCTKSHKRVILSKIHILGPLIRKKINYLLKKQTHTLLHVTMK